MEMPEYDYHEGDYNECLVILKHMEERGEISPCEQGIHVNAIVGAGFIPVLRHALNVAKRLAMEPSPVMVLDGILASDDRNEFDDARQIFNAMRAHLLREFEKDTTNDAR